MSLSSAADRTVARPAGASTDFSFLPKALTAKCSRLVESYHQVRGHAVLADTLWREQTRDFIEAHDSLHRLFHRGSIARSAKRSQQYYVTIATIILSLEILASGFADWGRRFPMARRRATLLLDDLPASRTRLMDTYLYDRWGQAAPQLLGTPRQDSRGPAREEPRAREIHAQDGHMGDLGPPK